jgi:hypothetical protein
LRTHHEKNRDHCIANARSWREKNIEDHAAEKLDGIAAQMAGCGRGRRAVARGELTEALPRAKRTPDRRTSVFVRLTRSIVLGGEHAEKGGIRELAKPQAEELIAQGSAVPLNFFPRFVARILLKFGSGG